MDTYTIMMPCIVFIRYNPHAFKVDGQTRRRPTVLRLARLVETVKEFTNTACTDEDVKIMYMYYDTNGDAPAVFADPDYDDAAKEWFDRVII